MRAVPLLEGVSSSRIRELITDGDLRGAAELFGRPFEVEGVVVAGDQRGGTLGFPTANLAPEAHMLIPAFGIYVGEALGTRAAVSIGVNPHYGGNERRIEAFLLDFEGDLYGERVRLELWEKLRDERGIRERGRPRRADRRRCRGRAGGHTPRHVTSAASFPPLRGSLSIWVPQPSPFAASAAGRSTARLSVREPGR